MGWNCRFIEALEHFRLTFDRRFDLGIGAFRRAVLAARKAGLTNHSEPAARRNPPLQMGYG